MGTRKKPVYRLVVADESKPLQGRDIEILGLYNPRQEPSLFDFKKDRVTEWLSKGAQPTESVRKLLGHVGVLPPLKFAPKPKKAETAEAAPTEAAAPAPAAESAKESPKAPESAPESTPESAPEAPKES